MDLWPKSMNEIIDEVGGIINEMLGDGRQRKDKQDAKKDE